jgi:hypothetical protein
MLGGVFQRLPQLLHCGIHSKLKVNKGIFQPEGRAQCFASDYLSVCLQQQSQDLEGLALKWYPHTGAEQRSAGQIDTISIEAGSRQT